jgi:hypothetical protein
MAQEKSDKERQSERTMRLLAVVMGAGLFGILVNAGSFWKQGQRPVLLVSSAISDNT